MTLLDETILRLQSQKQETLHRLALLRTELNRLSEMNKFRAWLMFFDRKGAIANIRGMIEALQGDVVSINKGLVNLHEVKKNLITQQTTTTP